MAKKFNIKLNHVPALTAYRTRVTPRLVAIALMIGLCSAEPWFLDEEYAIYQFTLRKSNVLHLTCSMIKRLLSFWSFICSAAILFWGCVHIGKICFEIMWLQNGQSEPQ